MFWNKFKRAPDEPAPRPAETFSPARQSAGTIDINPYMEARREWSTQVGTARRQAAGWRIGFFCSLAYAGVATVMLAALARTVEIIPHVVEVDREGRVLASYSGQSLSRLATENIIRSFIARWIEEFRGVTVDTERQNERLRYVAAHLRQDDSAFRVAADWLNENDPFDRAGSSTVVTRVRDLRRLGSSAWYVTWEERTVPRDGGAVRTEIFSAAMTVQQLDITEANAMRNPLGLYVRELDLSPEAF